MTLFKEAADIKTSDQLNLPTPTPIYHNEVAQPTEIQKQMVQELSERAARVHAQLVDPGTDNMLKITSDGRKLGLDQRIINPDLPDDPSSKVNRCVDNIHRIWQDGQADRLTQLVFCDLSTPKTGATGAKAAKTAGGNLDSPELNAVERLIDKENPDEPGFTVYDDIREKLVARGKKERFMANFYDADEVNRLFEISKGTKLEIPILFGAFYGMRRSETLGMKWDAIDFERDTITIRHTLTTVALDGKRITVAEDRTKNKSSMRTLPLVPFVKERLLELKAEQEENRRLCGRSYVKDYTGYVCINEIGDIIKPNYVSCGFPKLLEEHGLRRVRYHDLRHSCASLLLANGVPMKQIQEWLGHSDFSTTANIYAHLEYSSKVISADAMLAGLGIGNRE